MTYSNTHRGYTLLFAAITASVVLSVAVFVASVSRKQYILASAARDSLFAIYNADSAMECAAAGGNAVTVDGGTVYCNGAIYNVPDYSANEMVVPPEGFDTGYESQEIIIPFSGANGAELGCARVHFIHATNSTENTEGQIVISRGYNLGNASQCPKPAPRTVERAMQITYEAQL